MDVYVTYQRHGPGRVKAKRFDYVLGDSCAGYGDDTEGAFKDLMVKNGDYPSKHVVTEEEFKWLGEIESEL